MILYAAQTIAEGVRISTRLALMLNSHILVFAGQLTKILINLVATAIQFSINNRLVNEPSSK